MEVILFRLIKVIHIEQIACRIIHYFFFLIVRTLSMCSAKSATDVVKKNLTFQSSQEKYSEMKSNIEERSYGKNVTFKMRT